MSWLAFVSIGKCHDQEMSRMNIKCHGRQMTQWQMVGKCHVRQMSWSAFVRSANVGRQTSACKCLVGKRRFTLLSDVACSCTVVKFGRLTVLLTRWRLKGAFIKFCMTRPFYKDLDWHNWSFL